MEMARLLAAHRPAPLPDVTSPDASAVLHAEALPATRCRVVSSTWQSVARRGRLWLLLPTAVCADERRRARTEPSRALPLNHAEAESLHTSDDPPIPRVGHPQRVRTAALCDLSALNFFSSSGRSAVCLAMRTGKC
jgi:hypothetical protein